VPGKSCVFIIGFSGSGKTSVGQILARYLHGRFVDLDELIEKQQLQSIADIFRERGEPFFRHLEQGAFEQSVRNARGTTVIALGGGAFENPAIRRRSSENGTTVYLSCAARELYRRLRTCRDRPLLEVKPKTGETHAKARRRKIAELLSKRLPNYRRADIICSSTRRTPAQAARLVAHRLESLW